MSECVCVCVLKLTCKSVFLIPGNQQQTKFKHVLTQSTESLVYVRVWKTIVLQISHKKKNECHVFSYYLFPFFNVFHCFLLFINATLNYICTHLRRNVLNCWNSVCMWVCVCICFLRLITHGRGTQQRKLILGTEYLHNEDSPTHFDSLIQFNLSFRAISVKGLNLL